MREKIPLTVGQKLWYVPNSYGHRKQEGMEVTVTKIGRKWVHIEEGWREERLDPVTMRVDGGQFSSPATCYLSREEYEMGVEVEKEWRGLIQRISHNPPRGVSLASILEAKRLLGLDR